LDLRKAYVGGKSDEILERPIVEVEAEAKEAPLAGLDERALALRIPLEQHVALEHGGEQSRRLLEEGECA
jgi:hypothetical protein